MTSPFAAGSQVTWVEEVPAPWRYIWTPGPMLVVSSRSDHGDPSPYSQKFGGIPRRPGWIITVEYSVVSTNYYDPPLSLLLKKPRLHMDIHEQWLIPVARCLTHSKLRSPP